jgi:hypothetical protein
VKKTIYLLNIGDYAPELTDLTYPWIERYAKRIGADIFVMEERRSPEWPLTYEKLQIYDLSEQRGDDWMVYIDSDALIHPELPDVTELVPRDHVAHNANDWSVVRFTDDDYFRRDGRHIGSCNWFTIASSWCRDLWHPLELTPAQALEQIHVTVAEKAFMSRGHLIDDFALSRNIARYGLKFTTLQDIWRAGGLVRPDFFWHEYTITLEKKIENCEATMKKWGLT